MKKVVFLSWHYYNSKRKAGFHFLAKSLNERGFQVVFISSVISSFSFLRRERVIYEKDFNKNIFKPRVFNGVKSIINFSLLRPPLSTSSILLEFLAKIFFRLNKASINELRTADYIVFESTQAILFFDKIKSINANAKCIYRVSDDMEAMKGLKTTIEYERKVLEKFDLVSVPTKIMYDKFLKLSPNNVKLQFHGINKILYNQSKVSPYTEKINHVFIGNAYLDEKFIEIASSIYKDHFFHIIGAFTPSIKKNNVIYYGHMRFENTVPYVKFASTGLHNLSNEGGLATTFSDSLKVLQYSYCNLPIIAPSVIPAQHRKNFFYYDYNCANSIKSCIEEALRFDKSKFASNVKSWDELSTELIRY